MFWLNSHLVPSSPILSMPHHHHSLPISCVLFLIFIKPMKSSCVASICRDIYCTVDSLIGTTLLKKIGCRFLSFQEFLIISQLGVGLADRLLPTSWDSVFWLAPSEVFWKQSVLDHMYPIVSKKGAVSLYSCLYFWILQSFLISLPP